MPMINPLKGVEIDGILSVIGAEQNARVQMELFDTHAHLHFDDFNPDRDAVVQRSVEASVCGIVTLGTDLESSRVSLEIARRYSIVYAAAGIHPSEAHLAAEEDINAIRDLARRHPEIVAIGEIGLDFYWETRHHEAQYRMFGEMLSLASQLDMPVVIHNRSAHREMQWFFQEQSIDSLNGVMHCFSGDREDARFYLDMGLHISFTANITHKGFRREDVLRYVPSERIMIETDSPFIPPAERRKQRNEPANVMFVAQKLADVRGWTVEETARITTQNARRFFGLI